jgi:hypothetical protein
MICCLVFVYPPRRSSARDKGKAKTKKDQTVLSRLKGGYLKPSALRDEPRSAKSIPADSGWPIRFVFMAYLFGIVCTNFQAILFLNKQAVAYAVLRGDMPQGLLISICPSNKI